MKVVIWLIKFIVVLTVFLLLVVFATQNSEPVSLRLLLGHTWQMPLVLALLIFFGVGALLGIMSLLGFVFRQRREIQRLRREVAEAEAVVPLTAPTPPVL